LGAFLARAVPGASDTKEEPKMSNASMYTQDRFVAGLKARLAED
jgi:hypothetical protein